MTDRKGSFSVVVGGVGMWVTGCFILRGAPADRTAAFPALHQSGKSREHWVFIGGGIRPLFPYELCLFKIRLRDEQLEHPLHHVHGQLALIPFPRMPLGNEILLEEHGSRVGRVCEYKQ